MKNFEDNRVCLRLDPILKQWYSDNGGSRELRKALIQYYEQQEKKKYIGTGK